MAQRNFSPSQRGWLLVGLIIILSSVFVAMAVVSLLLGQSRQLISVRQNQTEAVYLAQAGVMQALYDLRRLSPSAGGIELRAYNVDNPSGPSPGPTDDAFILSGVAVDFFLANMKAASFEEKPLCGAGTKRDRLQDWPVTNVLSSVSVASGPTVTVTAMTVSWSPNASERVLRIDFDNTAVYSNCTGAGMGELIDLPDTTIGPRVTWTGSKDRIWFSSTAMDAKTSIDLTFIMTDGSRRIAHYEPTVTNRSADVTIRSVGEVRKGAFPFVTWRRLQAEYRLSGSSVVSSGNLLSYQELTAKTP